MHLTTAIRGVRVNQANTLETAQHTPYKVRGGVLQLVLALQLLKSADVHCTGLPAVPVACCPPGH